MLPVPLQKPCGPSVHDLSSSFLEFADEDWIRGFCTGLLNDSSIKIYRLLHVRYWIQAEFVRVAFGHLWNPDRHFLFSSLPVFSNIWHLQQYHFKRYNMLLADADNIPIQLMRLEGRNGNGFSTMQSTSEVCKEPLALAGLQLEFEQFWQRNAEDLRKMQIWELVPVDKIFEVQQTFIAFLLNVWLIHQLALAFEHPACIFEN